MKNFLLVTATLFAFSNVNAAAPNPSLYGKSQNINFSKISENTNVKVLLSQEILKANDTGFGKLQIIDNQNEPVSFFLQETPAKNIDYIQSLEVSSSKNKELIPENLLDNNRLTEFEFDKSKDKQNPSTVLVDFGKSVKINRIKLWKSNQSDIQGIEVKGGFDKNNLKTLKRKTKFKATLDSDFPEVQYLKISFWGKRIRLDDILFYTPYTASLHFQAQPNQKYKVLFGGNKDLDSKRYTQRTPDAPENFIIATNTKSRDNKLSSTDDLDNDGIKNSEDNCPFISNKSQKDTDKDSVGNKCDNAPKTKNYSQLDSDQDSIGDILDNCDFTPNKDQKDNDNDKIGNACDATPDAGNGKSFFSNLTSSSSDKNSESTSFSGGFFGMLAGIFAAIYGAVFFFIKRKK